MYTNFGAGGWNIRNNASVPVMFMTSAGNVGIGDTTPDSRLDVEGGDIRISTAGRGLIFPDGTKQTTAPIPITWPLRGPNKSAATPTYSFTADPDTGMYRGIYANQLRFATAAATRMTINAVGNVGIGTAMPADKLHVVGTIRADKLTVGTIDPIHKIDGVEYATYGSDFSGGVRIGTSGNLKLGVDNKFVIDFDNLEKGTNLWLFWQVSNRNMNDLTALLTPGFNGRVWYKKERNKLIIYGDQKGEVSFRLVLPREDYKNWPNLVKKQKKCVI